MSKTKLRRKDIKQPDEFVHLGQELLAWAQLHRNRILQGSVAVLIGLLAIGLWVSYRNANLRRANELLGQGLAHLRSNDWERASQELRKVAASWSTSTPGQIALLVAAQADLRAGSVEQARNSLPATDSAFSLAPYLEQQAMLARALALEKAGQYAEAATQAERAANLPGPYAATSLYEAARLYARAGNTEKGRALIEKLQREHGTAPEADWAKALALTNG
ncbi:MAG: hypothetical protein KatS3mg077_0195 [Candidatus Binatia bacterium]|nr:MAG: hypothetical protein KatS3mg077_0195 [Candidatus Binatia bacterium]